MPDFFVRKIFKDIAKDKQKSTFTLAIFSMLIVLFMFFVAIRPAVSSVIAQIAGNKERQELIDRQIAKETAISKLLETRDKYLFEIELSEEILPEFDDVEYVVANIEEYAKNNNEIKVTQMQFNYDDIKQDEGTLDPSIAIVEGQISFVTDRENLSKMIDYIENFPRPMNIKSLNLGSDSQGKNGEIGGNIKFVIYYLQPKADPPLSENIVPEGTN